MKETQFFRCSGKKLSPSALQACVTALQAGGTIIFPTDTVYGLACNAFHPAAIARIYKLKGRSYSKPLPILLNDASQLPFVATEVLEEARKLIEIHWPGALTLVFKTAPLALHAARGKSTIAVRVPDHPFARQILSAAQLPLATTSVNISGRKAVVSGEEAKKVFQGKVDVIIDGGPCDIGHESTVLDVTHFPFSVLREGALSKTQLARVLNLN